MFEEQSVWVSEKIHNLFIMSILVANKVYKHFALLAFWWALELQNKWDHTVNTKASVFIRRLQMYVLFASFFNVLQPFSP